MKQKFLDYSLELFCASVIVLTLIRILFFPELPLIRSLVAAYALIAVLHEFEEKRAPGGFFEMVQKVLHIDTQHMNLGLSSFFVMFYWIVVLALSFVFHNTVVLFIMLIVLGLLEMVGHTLLIFVGKLGKPYSPGMVSAWIMGAMSVYSIICINNADMASGLDYLIGTILMIIGFAIMQRATLITSGMSYRDLLKNIKNLFIKQKP